MAFGLGEEARKKLAKAVKSIQWSYAIFWSISSAQPGVIKWVDGYYNGDIKTRKTVQANELCTDELGLQRSDQLRELYNSLATEDSNQQAKRPSASLSPEDLTDTEWYYLLCMSFVFNIGQGLPGRTLASGQPTWVCNAPQADSKLFCRSLLAKSASIQTVACFPFSGGVIELGVTERVLEDPGLIQHVQASFLLSSPIMANELFDENLIQTDFNPIVGCEEANICYQTEDSFMIDGINAGASDQLQSFLLAGDAGTNDFQDSTSSSDGISQNSADTKNFSNIQVVEEEDEIRHIQSDEVHYQGVVSTILKASDKLMMGSYFRECDKVSSFTRWNKGKLVGIEMVQSGASQKLLKKVLFEVARMHTGCSLAHKEDNNETNDGIYSPGINEVIDSNHVLAERRRRERISERLSVLESLVPSTSKVDKVSILDNTIDYIRELKRRVGDVDSCKVTTAIETRSRKRSQCRRETPCDSYENSRKNDSKRKKPLVYGGESLDIGELEVEEPKDDVDVHVIEKDVSIEIKCPWRQCLLLEIIDEISRLRLDSHSVQSNNRDGMLIVNIQSKFKGSTVPARGIIKQAIQRVIQKF